MSLVFSGATNAMHGGSIVSVATEQRTASVCVCHEAEAMPVCSSNPQFVAEPKPRIMILYYIIITAVMERNSSVQCCFTSTETTRLIRDGEPRTSTSTFTQLSSSEYRVFKFSVALGPQRP